MLLLLELMWTYLYMLIRKKKGILILGEEPTPRLHDTAFTAEAKYPIDFTQSRKRLVLRLYIIMESTVSYLLML